MRSQINEEITFRKPEVLLAYMEGGNLTDAAEKLDISAVSVHRARHSLLSSHTISIHSLGRCSSSPPYCPSTWAFLPLSAPSWSAR